jgi:hypothetical protein
MEEEAVVKMNEKEINEIDKFVYLGSAVDKNGKIQNDINEEIGKASECCH